MLSFPKIKKRFPFTLGSTSYIVPADIIPNAMVLAPLVDDIELVLFESPDFSNIPSQNDVSVLKRISNENDTSYTIHFPIDRKAGSADPQERKFFCDNAKRIIDRCINLNPASWILHLEGIMSDASESMRSDWEQWCKETVRSITNAIPASESIAIENLGYPWLWHKNIALEYKTSLCCDIGHLWLYFANQWQQHLIQMLPCTRVIHLHGVSNGKDHISLSEGDPPTIQMFFDVIRHHSYTGIITLEVFNESDLVNSIEVIDKLWVK